MSNFRLARAILLWGLIINVLACAGCYLAGLDYPYTTFLFRPLDRFQDFYTVMRSTMELDPYEIRQVVNVPGHSGVEVSNYFPFMHLVLYPLTWLEPESALVVFILISAAACSYAFWLICKHLPPMSKAESIFNWLVFVPLCFPVLFTWDRGNVDAWMIPLVGYGIYCITTRRFHTGAIALGMAGAMKAMPLIFLFPLIREKQFKPFLTAGATVALTTFVSLLTFNGSPLENLAAMQTAFTLFGDFLLIVVNGITHSISLFAGLYTVVILWYRQLQPLETLQEWLHIYVLFSALLLAAILLYVGRARIPIWKQWLLLIGAVQILPFPSYEYRLLFSLIPLAFVIIDDRIPRAYVWLICLTIIPKFMPLFADVRVGVMLNPLLIAVTMAYAVYQTPSGQA